MDMLERFCDTEAKKHLGYYDEALPMLLKALESWKVEEPEDDVTIAKLHDTVGSV